MSLEPLAKTVEALLFLSNDPVPLADLAAATESDEESVKAALSELESELDEQGHGLLLRNVAGGYALATRPELADAARKLLAKPRVPALTPAQAETLAIVAYQQPVSRPEIARIRGVNADTATSTLEERGLIEESGRSRFGAILYRTSELFLKLFGLDSLEQLPDITQWDPDPEVEVEIRERLLRAGEQRLGVDATEGGTPSEVAAPQEPQAELDNSPL